MKLNQDPMEKAIRSLGCRNKVRCGEDVLHIACVVRQNDWRPLKADWWRKVTMDTYVQAVSDEKRKAQSKVVKMLLPGVRKREAV